MRKAGVVGWPIAHSRSPLIHGHWLETHGIEGTYERIPLPPDQAEAFFARFADQGLVGCNVTLPHKEMAARLVDERDEVAGRLDAVNTLWIEGGRVVGGNTDVYGFLANLDAEAPGWDDDPTIALVIGAGGAARGVVDGLVQRGFVVRVVNRTFERAEALATRYRARALAYEMTDLAKAARDAALVVNTTSVGMKGDGDLPLDLTRLGSESIVTDIVYVPIETPFLARARAAGLRTVDGLGMLLHQAVPGFERWFGVRPSVTPALRAIVEADIAG